MDNLIRTLPAILAASGASEEVAEAACIAAWKHAVGEALSSHAVAIGFQNKTLVVAVADIVWQKQLQHMRGQLLFRLNAVLGQPLVKSIDLRVDAARMAEVYAAASPNKKHEPTDYNIPAELLSAAAGITDVELRRAFLGAATSCINRLENPKPDACDQATISGPELKSEI